MRQGYNRTINTPGLYGGSPNGRSLSYDKLYIGFVKDNRDPIKMGRLKVWIPEFGGDSTDPTKWYTVNYCSPFAGATNPDKLKQDSKNYLETQQSYGFWAVPPDLENEVLVMFVNGDSNRGIWMGCLYQQFMNHMTPGIASNNSFDTTEDEIPPPVAEYNKWSNDVPANDAVNRPRFEPLYNSLLNQGLVGDQERGITSSSARRSDNHDDLYPKYGDSRDNEPKPAKVYGMKTPRGHQFVMDDDVGNEFIRFRTRTGTQLLIHETNGYVYINSKNGNSWVEISDDGINLYSNQSINMRAEKNFNLHVDGNYNLFVGGSHNVFVKGNSEQSVAGTSNLLFGKASKTQYNTDKTEIVDGNSVSYFKGTGTLVADNKLIVKSENELSIGANGNIIFSGATVTSNNGSKIEVKKPTNVSVSQPGKKDGIDKDTPVYSQLDTLTIVDTLLTHEPYIGHPIGDSSNYRLTPDNPDNEEGDTTEVRTGTGSKRIKRKGAKLGASSSKATKPKDITGTPKKGAKSGVYEGVKYDSKGNPVYNYKGDTKELKDASKLKSSDDGVNFIKEFEGTGPIKDGKLQKYNDVANLPTIGYGHLLTDSEKASNTVKINGQSVDISNGITPEQAVALKKQDLVRFEKAVSENVKVPLTQSQYDSLVSFSFNVGDGAFKKSTLLKKLNSGDYAAVPSELSKWDKAGGRQVKGLTRRRQAEADLFSKTPPTS